jgi:hypothetical protein
MSSIPTLERAASQISEDIPITPANASQINDDADDEDSSENFEDTTGLDNSDETLRAQMLESYAQAHDRSPGTRNFISINTNFFPCRRCRFLTA